MLERRHGLHQPTTPPVNEQAGRNPRLDVPQAVQQFRPAVDPIRVRHPQGDALPGILRRHGRAVALL